MVEPWRKGIITKIVQEAPATRRFWIQVPEINDFNFKPGQFVTLDLPIHEKPNKRWRSYSIASWPDGSNTLELVIVLLEGGLGTTYLFNEMQVGSELTLRGPQGVFTMPEELNKDLFLVCTGTGIAPFRSMVNHIKNHNLAHGDIHLIFGSRTKTDLLYFEEMKALVNQLPNFYYHPTLSREEWEGAKGYVHQVYEGLCRHNTQMVSTHDMPMLKPANFFLCGWKNMIDEARERIVRLGYEKKDIHFELYG
jgi:glycine betaine catabolism B